MNRARAILQRLGIDVHRHGPKRLRDCVITLPPQTPQRKGVALLAYLIKPFLCKDRGRVPSTHTNLIEALLIGDVLVGLGYEVDVIDGDNSTFIPSRDYDLLIATRKYFHLFADLVGRHCLKIAHLDVSHWLYNNNMALSRCREVFAARGVSLDSYRFIEPNWAIETADVATMLGNEFSIGTYAFGGKPIYPVPVPVYSHYQEPSKDVDRVRKNFLWFGSRGLVHKGLDLVLAAFADMPDYQLKVCGGIDMEPRFKQVFHRELYETANIQAMGWLDVTSDKFQQIANDSIALIYPSCSEGQSGAVVTCMSAGVIPVASRQSGVDMRPEYGRYIHGLTVDEVKASVRAVAALDAGELRSMSRNAWAYAREHHSREQYVARFQEVLELVLAGQKCVAQEERPLAAASVLPSRRSVRHASGTS